MKNSTNGNNKKGIGALDAVIIIALGRLHCGGCAGVSVFPLNGGPCRDRERYGGLRYIL